MARFFAEEGDIGEKIFLKGDNFRHGAKVLRLKPGDEITVCDGKGKDYTAVVSVVGKEEIICDISDVTSNGAESEIRVTLFQGLPKGEKLSFICEKCVEAGVYEIVPVSLSRCVVRLKPSEFEKKRERFQKIALSAAKQSGRGEIPEVGSLISLDEVLARKDEFDLFLFPYEMAEERSLKSALENFKGKKIALIIGPEGGFSPEEAEKIEKSGIPAVSLGKRILRTETAGLCALFNIFYELEQ